jgi:hypothetical protein
VCVRVSVGMSLRVCVCVAVCVPPGPVGPAGDAPGEVVLAVIAPRVVEEVRPRREALAVDHPAWRLGRNHTGFFYVECIFVHLVYRPGL